MGKTINQSMMFGMEPESIGTDPLMLTEPEADKWTKATDVLGNRYNKNQIWDIGTALHPMLRSHSSIFMKCQDGVKRPCREVMPIFNQNSSKNQLTKAVALILCEPANLQLYTDMLSDGMKALWRHLLIHIYTTEKEAQRILKTKNVLISKTRSYYYSAAKWNDKGFEFFNITNSLSTTLRYGYREHADYICLTTTMHQFFFPLFYPDAYRSDNALPQLPDGPEFQVFDFEAECVNKFSLLSGLLKAGEVSIKVRGVSQADTKKAAKKLGLQEFFPTDAYEDKACIRSRFYIPLLTLFKLDLFAPKERKRLLPYHETLHRIFETFRDISPYIVPMVLPHIKGLRKQILDSNACYNMSIFLCQWLMEEPEHWVALKDVFQKTYIYREEISQHLSFPTLVFYHTEQKADTEIVNNYSGRSISVENFATEFGYTVLQAMGFMLCSLGMAQIAVRTDDSQQPEAVTPFSQIEYIRLTPLGRYVLNVDKSYEAPVMDEDAYFELDPERLIIRSLVTPNPYAQLLLDSSTPISKNRYETSAKSFLAKCRSREDVENNISIFRQFISQELPPLWKQFFQSLLMHCHPLTADGTAYKHYKIAPENTELIRLLTTDEQLRKLVIRAEGYLILVKNEDIRRFEDQLKKHGYLL